jgi:U3 small nucleolar RNA-associated protein 11
MRNAVQRRNHRERAQPLGREKWGLLEKHKDYALRARDHKEKQKRLKILKEKASLANPDEFSFKMMSSRTRNGQKIADRGNKALSNDVVRLLKTQDTGYVRTLLQKTKKDRDRLEMEVQIEGAGRIVTLKGGAVEDEEDDEEKEKDEDEYKQATKKITFVESREEQQAMVIKGGSTDDDIGIAEKKKLSRREAEALRCTEIEAGRAKKKRAQQQEARRSLLEAVRRRGDDLALAEQELDLQRAKMSNSVGGISKNGVKFKIRERKR